MVIRRRLLGLGTGLLGHWLVHGRFILGLVQVVHLGAPVEQEVG
jgi:hypothetical protein